MTPGRPSRTAEAVCLMRALEQARPPADRILDDPYAAWFLSPLARTHLATVGAADSVVGVRPLLLPALTTYVQLRHRFMDDRFLEALDSVEQVVVLGAGYDMRAYRFASQIGSRPVFEVDYPATASRKLRILAPRRAELPAVDVRRVPIDFHTQRLEDVLAAAGFAPGRPTFFFWEGVSMYLRREAVKGTLDTLRRLGAPAHVVADFWYLLDSPELRATAHRFSTNLLHFIAEPITFGLHPEDTPDFLARRGWVAREVVVGEDLYRPYLAAPPPVYPGMYCVYAVSSPGPTDPSPR